MKGKLNKRESILVIVASLILLGAFFFPIWRIDLKAPQYPEGIGMRIWVDQITGAHEHDLHNINKLNHYIGMKPIVPEAIPELSIMPYLVTFFILMGLTAAVLKNKKLLLGWVAIIIVTLAIGLYDYYLWGYDYGHNLSSDAPIKIPGMTYQPPLIGSKQLLNIESYSFPSTGSFIIGISLLIGIYVLAANRRNAKAQT